MEARRRKHVAKARGPFIIAINPKVPASNLQELVALAKKEPGKLVYALAGNGSIVNW